MSKEVTAQEVKALREKTGAGIMACKNALVECEGDLEAAIGLLRKRKGVLVLTRAGAQMACREEHPEVTRLAVPRDAGLTRPTAMAVA